MSDTRSTGFYGALRVVWAIPVPVIPYEGKERVYVLLGLRFKNSRIITDMREVPNSSPFPKDTFSVLQKDVREITDALSPPKTILGYAHTHPENCIDPSINDIHGIARGMLGLVISSDNTHRWYVRGKVISPTVRNSLLASQEQV